MERELILQTKAGDGRAFGPAEQALINEDSVLILKAFDNLSYAEHLGHDFMAFLKNVVVEE